MEIFWNWVTSHSLAFHGWPRKCHGTCECVIWQLMYYNEHTLKCVVGVDLSTILHLVGSRHFMLCLQWLYHSFKDYVLLLSCLNLTFPLTALKNEDKGPIPEKELSTWIELLCELNVYTGRNLVKSVQISLCPMSLQDPANIYLPNIFFSFSIKIAFLPL